MRPTTCVVAADEPEIAANIEQPITVVWNRRPGRKLIHGAMPENSDCDSRVRNRSSPIRMNSGSETMSVEVRTLNVQAPISLVVGRLVKSSSSTTPTAINAGPIQMPTHSSAVIRTSSQVRMALMNYSMSWPMRKRMSSPGSPRNSRASRAMVCRVNCRAPTNMGNCTIQRSNSLFSGERESRT